MCRDNMPVSYKGSNISTSYRSNNPNAVVCKDYMATNCKSNELESCGTVACEFVIKQQSKVYKSISQSLQSSVRVKDTYVAKVTT